MIMKVLEIGEVSSAPLEFAPIDIINVLKIEGMALCDVDYGVLGNEIISLFIGGYPYFNIKNQFDDCEAVFNQWIKDGVTEDFFSMSHYLPHTGVFKELTTTKVRPMFEASCQGLLGNKDGINIFCDTVELKCSHLDKKKRFEYNSQNFACT
ncbi:hypothetical protein NPIL_703841 [Nephila pilipes]|uniref:Uncharacterized protein n=1 Tax=Nephila pilipes TaxID=299642 RepID=A0A8X6MUU9_NEPPI|nr:hypothetical protein NPIL_703841 [Nephila pilipes]